MSGTMILTSVLVVTSSGPDPRVMRRSCEVLEKEPTRIRLSPKVLPRTRVVKVEEEDQGCMDKLSNIDDSIMETRGLALKQPGMRPKDTWMMLAKRTRNCQGTRPPGLVKNEDDVAKQAGTDRLVLVREVKGCARSFR